MSSSIGFENDYGNNNYYTNNKKNNDDDDDDDNRVMMGINNTQINNNRNSNSNNSNNNSNASVSVNNISTNSIPAKQNQIQSIVDLMKQETTRNDFNQVPLWHVVSQNSLKWFKTVKPGNATTANDVDATGSANSSTSLDACIKKASNSYNEYNNNSSNNHEDQQQEIGEGIIAAACLLDSVIEESNTQQLEFEHLIREIISRLSNPPLSSSNTTTDQTDAASATATVVVEPSSSSSSVIDILNLFSACSRIFRKLVLGSTSTNTSNNNIETDQKIDGHEDGAGGFTFSPKVVEIEVLLLKKLPDGMKESDMQDYKKIINTFVFLGSALKRGDKMSEGLSAVLDLVLKPNHTNFYDSLTKLDVQHSSPSALTSFSMHESVGPLVAKVEHRRQFRLFAFLLFSMLSTADQTSWNQQAFSGKVVAIAGSKVNNAKSELAPLLLSPLGNSIFEALKGIVFSSSKAPARGMLHFIRNCKSNLRVDITLAKSLSIIASSGTWDPFLRRWFSPSFFMHLVVDASSRSVVKTFDNFKLNVISCDSGGGKTVSGFFNMKPDDDDSDSSVTNGVIYVTPVDFIDHHLSTDLDNVDRWRRDTFALVCFFRGLAVALNLCNFADHLGEILQGVRDQIISSNNNNIVVAGSRIAGPRRERDGDEGLVGHKEGANFKTFDFAIPRNDVDFGVFVQRLTDELKKHGRFDTIDSLLDPKKDKIHIFFDEMGGFPNIVRALCRVWPTVRKTLTLAFSESKDIDTTTTAEQLPTPFILVVAGAGIESFQDRTIGSLLAHFQNLTVDSTLLFKRSLVELAQRSKYWKFNSSNNNKNNNNNNATACSAQQQQQQQQQIGDDSFNFVCAVRDLLYREDKNDWIANPSDIYTCRFLQLVEHNSRFTAIALEKIEVTAKQNQTIWNFLGKNEAKLNEILRGILGSWITEMCQRFTGLNGMGVLQNDEARIRYLLQAVAISFEQITNISTLAWDRLACSTGLLSDRARIVPVEEFRKDGASRCEKILTNFDNDTSVLPFIDDSTPADDARYVRVYDSSISRYRVSESSIVLLLHYLGIMVLPSIGHAEWDLFETSVADYLVLRAIIQAPPRSTSAAPATSSSSARSGDPPLRVGQDTAANAKQNKTANPKSTTAKNATASRPVKSASKATSATTTTPTIASKFSSPREIFLVSQSAQFVQQEYLAHRLEQGSTRDPKKKNKIPSKNIASKNYFNDRKWSDLILKQNCALVLINAPQAAFADIIVLSKNKIILVQCKYYQTSKLVAADIDAEFDKMSNDVVLRFALECCAEASNSAVEVVYAIVGKSPANFPALKDFEKPFPTASFRTIVGTTNKLLESKHLVVAFGGTSRSNNNIDVNIANNNNNNNSKKKKKKKNNNDGDDDDDDDEVYGNNNCESAFYPVLQAPFSDQGVKDITPQTFGRIGWNGLLP